MTDNVKPEPAGLEKMDGTSLDIAEQRRRELKLLLPGVFTETTAPDGQPVETVDFERLKAELGTFSDVYEGRRERYGMEWPGKRDCMKLIQEPSRATLKPCREESVDFDTTQNLFIEGDNLEVLKLLQKSYYGKVKMIYIDPPYNTGNEFIYPDNYAESLETYLAYAGLVDDEGRKFSTNTATVGRFHTKWLNMMYPRLYLARNLLQEDGMVFISIDDNEIENLRRMCDEIFGEENFKGQITRATGTPTGQGNDRLVNELDYVVVYSKSPLAVIKGLPLSDKDEKIYDQEDQRGKYLTRPLRKTGGEDRKEDRPSMFFPVKNPDGVDVFPIGPGGYESRWRCGKSRYEELVAEGLIEWKRVTENEKQIWKPYQKFYLEGRLKQPSNLWMNIEGNKKASRDIRKLFGGKAFDFPKPLELIKKCIQISTSKNDIVLDFFAGSATTAHAILSMNLEDGDCRSFISVQLPEPCDPESESGRLGYTNIAEIGKERIRRAAQQIREQRDGTLDLEEKGEFDLGFKALKLDQSNFKAWQTPSEEPSTDQLNQQLALHTDHIEPNAGQEDILYELLIKAGFVPTEKIDALDLAGKQVFSIAEGALLICLEDQLTSELIDVVADREPMQFICLDKGFKGNDQLKANAVQTFKSRSRGAETEMVFKVV